METEPLKVGDIVLIRHAKQPDELLSSVGILNDECYVSKCIDRIENCLWEVHVQNQYSAMKEYHEGLLSGLFSGRDDEPDLRDFLARDGFENMRDSDDVLHQLQKDAFHEVRLNEKLMGMKLGKPIAFGDVIQLRHVKSKKFITVNGSVLAKHERENLKVSLDELGDTLSWIECMPRSKFDREGQHVMNNSELFLRVHEKPDEFLHCAKRSGGTHFTAKSTHFEEKSDEKEVNCSLESTCWTITVYQRIVNASCRSICAGSVVSLQEPESSAFVTVDKINSLGDSAHVIMSSLPQLSIDSHTCNVGTGQLWWLEKENVFSGGEFSTRGERIVLRDFNSGKYMSIDRNNKVVVVTNRNEGTVFELIPAQQSVGGSILEGSAVHLYSGDGWVAVPTVLRRPRGSLEVVGADEEDVRPSNPAMVTSLKRGSIFEASTVIFGSSCFSVADRALSSSFVLSSQLQRVVGVDLFVGIEAARNLRSFQAAVQSALHVGSSESAHVLDHAAKTLYATLDYIYEFLTSTDDVAPLSYKEALSVEAKRLFSDSGRVDNMRVIRQSMLREQLVLDYIVDIIEVCGSGSLNRLFADSSAKPQHPVMGIKSTAMRAMFIKQSSSKRLGSFAEVPPRETATSTPTSRTPIKRSFTPAMVLKSFSRGESLSYDDIPTSLLPAKESKQQSSAPHRPRALTASVLPSSGRTFDGKKMAHELCTSCLKTLMVVIRANHANQMHIADRFPVILNQIKDQEVAVKCVQEMLRDNLRMLQTKVREREVGIFLELLERSQMSATILRLLQSACSCPIGVDSTQRMVVRALFAHANPDNAMDIVPSPAKLELAVDNRIITWSELRSCSISDEKEEDGSSDGESSSRSVTSSSCRQNSVNWPQRNLLIRVTMNPKIRKKVHITHKSIYLPNSFEELREVSAYSIVEKGLPQLSVSWTSSEESYEMSMLHLFGHSRDLPYELLCDYATSSSNRDVLRNTSSWNSRTASVNRVVFSSEDNVDTDGNQFTTRTSSAIIRAKRKTMSLQRHSHMKSKPKRKTDISETKSPVVKKRMVAEYFCAQLYLVADLCLDRNYVSMTIVEKSFPYDMLIAMLLHKKSSPLVRAPVCRMLRCLYVDREPQTEAKFPRLIRTSASLDGSPYAFAVLQQIISEYLHNELDTTSCDEFSAEMIDLLLALVKFGFYNTPIQLCDIVAPLIRALDEHRQSFDSRSRSDLNQTVMLSAADDDDYGAVDGNEAGVNNSPVKSESISPPNKTLTRNRSAWSWNNLSFRGDASGKVAPDLESRPSIKNLRASMFHKRASIRNSFVGLLPGQDEGTAFSRSRSVRLMGSTNHGMSVSSLSRGDSFSVEERWQQRVLDFLESFGFMLLILLLVILSTVIAAVSVAGGEGNLPIGMAEFDVAISVFFVAELILRFYCYVSVWEEIRPFFAKWFHLLDIFVVLLDVLLLILRGGSVLGTHAVEITRFVKTLRFVRIIRLLRVCRAARLFRSIAGSASAAQVTWTTPARFTTTNENEIKTIIGILKILAIVNDRMHDRKLNICIRAFSKWFNAAIQGRSRDPFEVFQHALAEDSDILPTFPDMIDDVLLDIIMHTDNSLAQEALSLLMTHKNKEAIFVETAKKIQIITSTKLEAIYKNICSHLRDLKTLADSYEIWRNLRNEVEKDAVERLIFVLESLVSLTTSQSDKRKFDYERETTGDPEVQRILLNSDAMSHFMALLQVIFDSKESQLSEPIRKSILLCNSVIIISINNNADAQKAAFHYLEWFMERIDCGLKCSKVVRAILSNNRELVKKCPAKYVEECILKLINVGRNPDYLDLFVGLVEGDNGSADNMMSSVRSEISRHITNREKSKVLIEWCSSPGSSQYKERCAAMKPYLHLPAVDDEALPTNLKYHINMLHLLAGCRLGQKLQAIYPLDDIVAGILDSNTIFNVRRSLGVLLIEMVENRLDGVEGSESMYRLMDKSLLDINDYMTELSSLFSKDVSSLQRRQCSEWMLITLNIISAYFADFDFLAFHEATVFENDLSFETTHRTEEDIQVILGSLSSSLGQLYRKYDSMLGPTLTAAMKRAMEAIRIVAAGDDEGDVSPQRNESPVNSLQSAEVSGRALDRQQIQNKREFRKLQSSADAIHEAYYRKQYLVFLNGIMKHQVQGVDLASAMRLFENLPSVNASYIVSDVRFEPLVEKIVSHIRLKLKHGTTSRSLVGSVGQSARWLLDTWTAMLEKHLGYSVDQLSDPRHIGNICDCKRLQYTFDRCGATQLCLELIAVGIDASIVSSAVRMLIALLASNINNIDIQSSTYDYLRSTDSTLFFEEVREIIEQQILWCHREAAATNSIDCPPLASCMLKLLHSICDGSLMPTKNILREQEGNARYVNVLDSLASFLDLLSRLDPLKFADVALRVVHTTLAVIQGPCVSNIEHFVLHTNMLAGLNRILRSSPAGVSSRSANNNAFDTLREHIIDVLRAFIEGQTRGSVIVERVQTAIELNVLNVLIVPPKVNDYGDVITLTAPSSLQAKYLVFLRTLRDDDADIPANVLERVSQDVACVEVVIDGSTHRNYFYLPDITKSLTESSKRKLEEEIEFSTQELKLMDFMRRAKELYREAVHQRMLVNIGVGNVWQYKSTLTWIMLLNVFIMNILLICFYAEGYSSGYATYRIDKSNQKFLPKSVESILFSLNVIHALLAIATLSIFLIVRVPVKYNSYHLDHHFDPLRSVLLALMDPLPFWYLLYLFISLLSLMKNYLFASLLLLDFVILDSTSRDVLYAVVYPIRQLATALFIIFITVNIFAAAIFHFFRDDFDFDHIHSTSLWETLKMSITYGVRANEGIGQSMIPSIGNRFILDMIFYFTITVVLLNIFFGIIIDTFGKLRNLKVDREAERNKKCFICGLDVHDFSRGGMSMTFQEHRKMVHNMWHYLFFVMRIWHQPRSQDNSAEMKVRQMIEAGDITWFPIGTSFTQMRPASDSNRDALDLLGRSASGGRDNGTPRDEESWKSAFDALGVKLDRLSAKIARLEDGAGIPDTSSLKNMIADCIREQLLPLIQQPKQQPS